MSPESAGRRWFASAAERSGWITFPHPANPDQRSDADPSPASPDRSSDAALASLFSSPGTVSVDGIFPPHSPAFLPHLAQPARSFNFDVNSSVSTSDSAFFESTVLKLLFSGFSGEICPPTGFRKTVNRIRRDLTAVRGPTLSILVDENAKFLVGV